MTTTKPKNFKEAYERLQKIANYLEDEEIVDVDKLIELQKEAKELYTLCSDKLNTATKSLNDDSKEWKN